LAEAVDALVRRQVKRLLRRSHRVAGHRSRFNLAALRRLLQQHVTGGIEESDCAGLFVDPHLNFLRAHGNNIAGLLPRQMNRLRGRHNRD